MPPDGTPTAIDVRGEYVDVLLKIDVAEYAKRERGVPYKAVVRPGPGLDDHA
jgi:hypothetical protein